jgi:hypothetical protein
MKTTITKNYLSKILPLSVMAAVLTLSFWSDLLAQEKVGEISFYQGTVEVKRANRLTKVSLNQDVLVGDVITTGVNSRASIRLLDKSQVLLDQRTVYEPKEAENILTKGAVFVKAAKQKVGGDKEYKVKTPSAVAAISGTEFFLLEIDKGSPLTVLGNTYDEGASIVVAEGLIDFSNDVGRVRIKDNQWGLLKKGQRPTPPVDVDASKFIPGWVKEVLEAEGKAQD